MTGGEIMAVVSFFVMLMGAAGGVWWRVEGKVKVAEDKADRAREDLAAYKTHIAESYVTKTGMQEQTAQLLRAIEAVIARIDGLSSRLDRVVERSHGE